MAQDIDVRSSEDTIEWYNQNAQKYAESVEAYASLDEIDEFVALLPSRAQVLDAGCGSGRDTGLLQARGVQAIGLDLSSGLIRVAKERHPGIKFIEGSFLDLDFENTTFDGIWAHASLLHLSTLADVKQALSEFNRVLKLGGVMYVLVKAQTGVEKTAIVSDAFSSHDRFFQYFTKEEISSLLSEAGFENIKIEQYRETDKNPKGRFEVQWILSLSKKVKEETSKP